MAELDIINRALSLLGERPISSRDNPTSKNELAADRWYDESRLQLLEYHPWDFAEGRYDCPRSGASEDSSEYTDKYRLPNDFVALIHIKADGVYSDEYGELDWSREGNEILLNAAGATSIGVVYTKDIKDTTKFTPLFRKALARRLAADMALDITSDLKKQAQMETLAEQELSRATSIDGQGKRVRKVEYSKAIAARRSGRPLYRDPYRING